MTLAIHHVALNAVDRDAAARLYIEGAGFRAVDHAGDSWLAGPNGYLLVAPTAGPIGARERDRRVCDAGITHICVQSGAGRALWDRLAAAGYSVREIGNSECAKLDGGMSCLSLRFTPRP